MKNELCIVLGDNNIAKLSYLKNEGLKLQYNDLEHVIFIFQNELKPNEWDCRLICKNIIFEILDGKINNSEELNDYLNEELNLYILN